MCALIFQRIRWESSISTACSRRRPRTSSRSHKSPSSGRCSYTSRHTTSFDLERLYGSCFIMFTSQIGLTTSKHNDHVKKLHNGSNLHHHACLMTTQEACWDVYTYMILYLCINLQAATCHVSVHDSLCSGDYTGIDSDQLRLHPLDYGDAAHPPRRPRPRRPHPERLRRSLTTPTTDHIDHVPSGSAKLRPRRP